MGLAPPSASQARVFPELALWARLGGILPMLLEHTPGVGPCTLDPGYDGKDAALGAAEVAVAGCIWSPWLACVASGMFTVCGT